MDGRKSPFMLRGMENPQNIREGEDDVEDQRIIQFEDGFYVCHRLENQQTPPGTRTYEYRGEGMPSFELFLDDDDDLVRGLDDQTRLQSSEANNLTGNVNVPNAGQGDTQLEPLATFTTPRSDPDIVSDEDQALWNEAKEQIIEERGEEFLGNHAHAEGLMYSIIKNRFLLLKQHAKPARINATNPEFPHHEYSTPGLEKAMSRHLSTQFAAGNESKWEEDIEIENAMEDEDAIHENYEQL